jgi:hypothetical protein
MRGDWGSIPSRGQFGEAPPSTALPERQKEQFYSSDSSRESRNWGLRSPHPISHIRVGQPASQLASTTKKERGEREGQRRAQTTLPPALAATEGLTPPARTTIQLLVAASCRPGSLLITGSDPITNIDPLVSGLTQRQRNTFRPLLLAGWDWTGRAGSNSFSTGDNFH